MRVINDEKISIKMWLDTIEPGAEKQARNLANLAGAFHHIAIMPDAHIGYGMPIGGVMATKDIIVPNAVGVDIGCGIIAAKTSLREISQEELKKIIHEMTRSVPTGFRHHKTVQEWDGFNKAPNVPVIQKELNSARKQIGTLGGGNHFIEILKEIDDARWGIEGRGDIWLMIHSGSRNFGLKAASVYHKKAKEYCAREKVDLPDADMSFLPLISRDGQDYFSAQEFAQEFAQANRALMMRRFMKTLKDFTGCEFVDIKKDVSFVSGSSRRFAPSSNSADRQDDSGADEPWIWAHHNYAAKEKHFGEMVIVHRKGAIRAFSGQLGIVPGSMGTPSYIVEGLGNQDSFMSSAHGAGRAMGRKQANRELDRKAVDKAIAGIVFTGWHGNIDEAPQAYKDIEMVMEAQKDLAKPIIKLKPIAVMIGN